MWKMACAVGIGLVVIVLIGYWRRDPRQRFRGGPLY